MADVALVAVAALPVILPAIGLVTVRLPKVPTEVNEDVTTPEASVVPVREFAAADAEMLIFAEPSNATPFMVLAVASLVAVPEFPITDPAMGAVTDSPLKVPTEVIAGCAASVTVPAVCAELAVVELAALPVILPSIGLLTVRFAKVPTEVREEFNTVDFKVVPVSWFASAAAEMVISAVPLKGTPLIFLGVARAVAVAAFPVTLPAIGFVTVNPVKVPTEVMAGCAAVVTVAAEPVTFPVIGFVTVNPVKVPTDVIAGCAAVVTVPALVALVAVAALPVMLPAIGFVTVRPVNVPTEVSDEFNTVDFKVEPVN